MIRRQETDSADRDERLGEAIEAYMTLAESGPAPDPEAFAAGYPDLSDDLRAALEGLALVQGLVGEPSGPGHHRLEVGQRVAGYRIVRELGRGGMGIVYEAVHVDLDRPVALKVLGTHAAPDSTGRRRFLNEARTAAGLHHTHIVPVFDVGQVGGLCYYAMQRVEGSGLDRVIRALRRDRSTAAGSTTRREAWAIEAEAGTEAQAPPGQDTATWFGEGTGKAPLRPGRGGRPRTDDDAPPFVPPRGSGYSVGVAEVGRRAAEALAHAHGRGVIHRDVKPSNHRVDVRGSIWVADFGLARRLADPGLTQSDSLLGTPRYMSPEQIDGGPTDGRTDVYGLGATLYELLTLRPPFDGRTAVELHRQITGRDPIAPRYLDPKIPRDLETIALKAMARRPADRYATAADLADDLLRFLRFEPVRARRISPVGRLWRLARRHPGLSIVSTTAAATVLAVTAIAFSWVVHERDEALRAKDEARNALSATKAANRATEAAMQRQLASEARVTRFSTLPDRRELGLTLLKRTAAMGPALAPDLARDLRGEALEFLGLHEARRAGQADIPDGRIRALAVRPTDARLVVLADAGVEVPGKDEGDAQRLWSIDPRTGAERLIPEPIGGAFAAPGGGPRRGSAGLIPVGPHLAVSRSDGPGLRLLDATTGQELDTLPMPGRNILALYASPANPTRLVTIDRIEGRRGGPGPTGGPPTTQVNLWDLERPDEPIRTLEEGVVTAGFRLPGLVAFGPDGRTIATTLLAEANTATRPEARISLWEADDGEPLPQPRAPITTQASPTALALGPDGLLAVAAAGAVRLWDTATGTALPGLTPSMNFVRLLRFNADGSLLAMAAGWDAGVELWDPIGNAPVATLPTTGPIADLAFLPGDGRTLAIGQGNSVAFWKAHEPIGSARISGFVSPPTMLAFGPDGLLAMAARDEEPRIWNPRRPSGAAQTLPGVKPVSLRFDAGGRLAVLEPDALRWYRPSSLVPEAELDLPDPPGRGFRGRGNNERGLSSKGEGSSRIREWMSPPVLAGSADGRTLVLARSSDLLIWSADAPGTIQALASGSDLRPAPSNPDRLAPASHRPPPPDGSPRPGNSPRTGPRPEPGPNRSWRAIALAPEGDRLFLLAGFPGESELIAWDLATRPPRPLADWQAPPVDATTMALSPDGRTLALGDDDGVALADAGRGAIRARIAPPDDEDVRALAFGPDGATLAVGTARGAIYLWRLSGPEPELLTRLPGHRGQISALAFDAEGRLAAGGFDQVVMVWDLPRIQEQLRALGLAW